MAIIAAISKLAFMLLVALNWLYACFSRRSKLYNARFARLDELASLSALNPDKEGTLILGISQLNRVLRVKPVKTRRELGNLLVVAPTRGGKGLLAVSQLLAWKHSIVVNDIKGELFTKTAGYRSTLGPVFVIDPTGVGHRYDPLCGKQTEDELLSSSTQLLFRPNEGDGAIFTQRAIVMLTQMFLAARKLGAYPLPYTRTLIRMGLVKCVEALQSISPELATQFLTVDYDEANFNDRFLLSCWGTLDTLMRPPSHRKSYPLPFRLRLQTGGSYVRGKTSYCVSSLAGARPPRPRAPCETPLGLIHRRASYNL